MFSRNKLRYTARSASQSRMKRRPFSTLRQMVGNINGKHPSESSHNTNAIRKHLALLGMYFTQPRSSAMPVAMAFARMNNS
jgi:hypothetical protein